MDWIHYYGRILWYKVVYAIFVVIYLVRLDRFNKELNEQNFGSAIALLQYKEWFAMKLFGLAVLFFALGLYLMYCEIQKIRMKLNSEDEAIISFVTIIVIAALLLQIILYINNPILQAILVVLGAGALCIAVLTN